MNIQRARNTVATAFVLSALPVMADVVAVNIDFNITDSDKMYAGQGAYSDPGNDYWNTPSMGNGTPSSIDRLLASDGVTLTAATVANIDHTGSHERTDYNNSLLRDGAVNLSTLTIGGLDDAATYDLYLYSTFDNFGSNFTVGGSSVSVDSSPTSAPYQEGLVEGETWGLLTGLSPSGGEITVSITKSNPANTGTFLTGLQIVGEIPLAVSNDTGVINVDFGSDDYDGQGAQPDPGNTYWNSGSAINFSATDLLASNGLTVTTVDVSMPNTGSHTRLDYTHKLLRDGLVLTGSGIMNLDGLDNSRTYTLTLYGTFDDYSFDFTADGKSTGLAGSRNAAPYQQTLVDGETFATLSGLQPDALGTLDVTITPTGVTGRSFVTGFQIAVESTGPVSDLVIDSDVSQSTKPQPTPISIPFSNAGTVELVISGVTPSGADAAYFSVQSFTSPVASGGNGTLEILFTPGDGPRTYSASLDITCNDPDSPLSTALSITATGANQLGNLLLVGDSLTEGRNGVSPPENGYSWRYFFWQRCVDYSVGHQFVGTRTSNKDGTVSYPGYLGQTFTNRHEAIWGTTANEREANLDARLNTMAGSASTPDTVVMFVGGNGVSTGTTVEAAQIADIASDISLMINMVQGEVGGVTGNPNVTVYLVSILPRFPGSTPDDRNANGFTALNNAMSAMPAAQSTTTSKVRYLDLFSAMNDSGYYYDGTHPNAAGADRLAELIFSGMIADRDTDQLADGWEKAYFIDVNATDGSVDSDGDLIPDDGEYAAGSSPVDASSRPPQLTLDPTGHLRITIPATDPVQFGDLVRHYTIRSSTDLIDWSNIVQSGVANGSEIIVPNTFDQPAEFYRVGMTVK